MPTEKSEGAVQFARLLWADEYAPFMDAERAEAREAYMSLPQSRYHRILKGVTAETYDEKAASRFGRNTAVLARGFQHEGVDFQHHRSLDIICMPTSTQACIPGRA